MGILLSQQLRGRVFGLQVAKGEVFIAALAAPVFLLGSVCAGAELAAGQQRVSHQHSESQAWLQPVF